MNTDQTLNYEKSEDVLKDKVLDSSIEIVDTSVGKNSEHDDNHIYIGDSKPMKLEEIEEGQIEEILEENRYSDLKDDNQKYLRSNSSMKPKGICKYHVNGICHWGIMCKFVHDGVNNLGAYKLFTYSNDLAKFRDIKSNTDQPSNISLIPSNDIVLSNPMDPYSSDVGNYQEKSASPWEKALIKIRNLQVERTSLTQRDKTELKYGSNYNATYHTPKLKLNDSGDRKISSDNYHGSSKTSSTNNHFANKNTKFNHYYHNSINHMNDKSKSSVDELKLSYSKYSKGYNKQSRSREESIDNNELSYFNKFEDRKLSILKEMRDIEDTIKLKKNK